MSKNRKKKLIVKSADDKQRNNIVRIIFGKKDDVYITFDDINNDLKASIHCSGKVHVAFNGTYICKSGIKNKERYLDERHLLLIDEDGIESINGNDKMSLIGKYEIALCLGFLPSETIRISEEECEEDTIILNHYSEKEMIIVAFMVATLKETYSFGLEDWTILYKTNLPCSRKEFLIAGIRGDIDMQLVNNAKKEMRRMIRDNGEKEKLCQWATIGLNCSDYLPTVLFHFNTSS